MPIYEYKCPKHGKFELIQPVSQRYVGKCRLCELKISSFNIYGLNWMQKDGEGFTQKAMELHEYGELNQELRER